MRIAYVNNDEVNQDLTSRAAGECGAVVCGLIPDGPSPDGLFDAVLYNLDDMPRDRRSALLERLIQAPPDRPTAVHGYEVTDVQASSLNRNGVAAARRLHFNLILDLIIAVRKSIAAAPQNDTRTDLTWVNLSR